MGYDKYGLNWNVWGSTPAAPADAEPAPLKTLHSSSNRNTKEKRAPVAEDIDVSENLSTPPPAKQKPTCTLANARFLSDATTDFNKPCTIIVDVDGEPAGPISFTLRATYKETDYDLQHVQTAFENEGKAEAALKLFYVDQHYHDLYSNGDQNAVVEYYALVSNKAAREIKSEVLRMPLENRLLISFTDEDGYAYTDLSFKESDGTEITIKAGKATLNTDGMSVELLFPTIAMNFQPGTMPPVV